MENVLQEIMFIGPSSPAIRFVLVDEEFVKGLDPQGSVERERKGDGIGSGEGETRLPRCFSRNQRNAFEETLEQEEEVWRRRNGEGEEEGGGAKKRERNLESFQEYRVVVESGM